MSNWKPAILPVKYEEDRDLIEVIAGKSYQKIVAVVEPVTGYPGYTHLVRLAMGAPWSFALATLTEGEVSGLPTAKQYNDDELEAIEEAFG